MSNLKHLSIKELQAEVQKCENIIKKHSAIVSGQKERLKWAKIYIERKTPPPTFQELMEANIKRINEELK